MNRRIAFSVVSIRDTCGLPPAGANVAATIENLCTSRLTHRRTSAGAIEDNVRHGLVLHRSYAALALRPSTTAIVQPAKDATHEDQPACVHTD
jgi:hypothetical protein